MGGPICHFRFSFLSCSLDGTVQEEAAAAGSTGMEYLANYCRLHGYTKADGQLRAVLLWHLTSDAQVGCIRAVFCSMFFGIPCSTWKRDAVMSVQVERAPF